MAPNYWQGLVYLVPSSSVAGVDPGQASAQMSQCVYAQRPLAERSRTDVSRVRQPQFRVDVVQVPLEIVALQAVPEV